MPDLAAGLTTVTPAMKAHLDTCPECAGKLDAFRQTMALLDEWQAPEPSPYFDVRLNAGLREESRKREAAAGWLHWLRKPALAVSFALLMVASVTLVRMNNGRNGNGSAGINPSAGGGCCNSNRGRARHGSGRFAGAGQKPEPVLRLRRTR